MSWTLLLGVVLVLGLSLFAAKSRKAELARMQRSLDQRIRSDPGRGPSALLSQPVVDLSRCMGCGTCIRACPEENVLDLIHGQAAVVNASQCNGTAQCEAECPVDAIKVTIANVEARGDIPAVTAELEAIGSPGLFLAGEVTATSRIKKAVVHGTGVAAEVAHRTKNARDQSGNALDLCIVGAGPAGLACALEAKRRGLHFVVLEKETQVGGTVAKYPRRKMVLTDRVDLPLYGPLARGEFSKEQLMEIWQGIATAELLPIQCEQEYEGLERGEDGIYTVRAGGRSYQARHVCLALGRRGVARKLDIPGEDSLKVSHSLSEASSFQGLRILVIGGGDSAAETAIALAEQPGNRVTLSYRGQDFFRMRSVNKQRLEKAERLGKLDVLRSSLPLVIGDENVQLQVEGESDPLLLPNDHVFVMAGGVAPIDLLKRSGLRFGGDNKQTGQPMEDMGTGLTNALSIAFALALVALAWAIWHGDYYLLSTAHRPAHEKHTWLSPSEGLGLWLGIGATVLICVNLLYLVRRQAPLRFRFGSLRTWMTSHVATGVLAALCAALHGAMNPRDTVGGHAFWALTALLVTGGIGRYLYAWIPRAANGRELDLEEVKARLGRAPEDWNRGQLKYHRHVRDQVLAMIAKRQWRDSLPSRLWALFGNQRSLHQLLTKLAREGLRQGLTDDQVRESMQLARQANRSALIAAHFEDLRGLLNGWRYLHRWVAALMVLLVVIHVAFALIYGESSSPVPLP